VPEASEAVHVYVQCGMRIRSEIEMHLPHLPSSEWDVDVRWGPPIVDTTPPPPGEVIASYVQGEVAWYTATATDEGYIVRFRDCGDFVISDDLSCIEVSPNPDPSGRADLLPILLAGTVSAILLSLAGHTVLHASAVAADDTAIAFVGQSGRGKSTVAALLCVAGASLVTDDVLVVDAGPPPTCIGGANELRLREGASSIPHARPEIAVRTTEDDRVAFAPPAAQAASISLGGIVIPAPSREAQQVEAALVPPSTAVFKLLAFPRVHGWTRREVLAREFATLSELVNSVPVYEVVIPWGPPFDPAVAPAIIELVVGRNR